MNSKPVLIALAICISPLIGAAQEGGACEHVNRIMTSAQEYFDGIRGESVSFEIRGIPKPYLKSTVDFKEGTVLYITEDELYPEAVSYLAKTRFYSPELQAEYDRVKDLLRQCLGEEWVFVEKDKTNDIYLEDTDYRKAVFTENKKGKKVKVEVFMYNQRELDTWCVELKIFGIGRRL